MPLSPQEQQELAQLESKYGKPKASSLSPQEQEELKALEAKYGQGEQKEAPGLGHRALDYGLRALDYPGGLVRTGAAGLLGVAGKEDFKKALYGQAPTSADYLERGGVGEGFRVNLSPMEGDTSLRDIAGFALDTLSDPLTAIARGVRGAKGLAGKAADVALNPAEKALDRAGTGLYKSGLKRIDQEVARYGKDPVSDVLMRERITGNAKQIFDKMDELGKKLYGERQEILKSATRSGAEVDMKKAMAKAQSYVDELRKTDNPELIPAINMMQNRINKYLAKGAKEPEQILRELPTSRYVPEYRPITGYEKGGQNFIELPRPNISVEAKLKNPVPYYEAETLSNPGLLNGELSPKFSGRDLLLRDAKKQKPRFVKQLSEPVIRNEEDLIKSLPVGADYQDVFRPGMSVGLENVPDKINYGPIVPSRFEPGPAKAVIDYSERVPGPSPLQATSWKTTSANRAGDAAYETMAKSAENKAFEKALSGGLRKSTEEAVGKLLGKEKELELARKNADLGKILTSKERALLDAEQELRKNLLTSVDGMILGANNPTMALVKKLADFSKMTGPRTRGGLMMKDAAKSGLIDPTIRRGLIDANRD